MRIFLFAMSQSVTLEDVVEPTQVGVRDAVIIELIQLNNTTHLLTPARLRAL